MGITKLYNAKDELEANMIASILKESGIECLIQDVGAGQYLNISMGFTVYGKDIYVDEGQYEAAKVIIDEIVLERTEDSTEDSEPLNIPWYKKKEWLVRGMFLLPVVMFVIFGALNLFGIL